MEIKEGRKKETRRRIYRLKRKKGGEEEEMEIKEVRKNKIWRIWR